MVRDYSAFLPSAGSSSETRRDRTLLERLGWQPFFARQTSVEGLARTPPVRVVEVHRSGLHVRGEEIDAVVPPGPEATVGDWLLYDAEAPRASEVLERKSLFKRRAAGTERRVQLIAANVDTAFLVTSCNHDFNVARMERYVALSFEAGTAPVIVLTKPDLCDDPAPFLESATAISERAPVVVVNALSEDAPRALADWCRPGQTVGFLGSSGVGKSTLVNALSGETVAATGAIRKDDSKGRHTTSHRQLHLAAGGFTVLDTPGMRELQVAEAGEGIDNVFEDLAELALQCRFKDCSHEVEPGCAVRAAAEAGHIDADRVGRWLKLVAEERFNTASLAERKAGGKSLARVIRTMKRLHREHGK